MSAHLQSSDASSAAILGRSFADQTAPIVLFEAAAVIAAIITLAGIWRGSARGVGGGLAGVCVAAVMVWNGSIQPIEARTRSQVAFAAQVRALTGSSPVYVAYFDPEFAWYFGPGAPPLPAAIARGGAPAGQHVYLVARPRELARLAPSIRQTARLVLPSQLLGGGGAPGLYEIPSAAAQDRLKGLTQLGKKP